jgi:two-component system response regulator YesN
MAFRFPKFLTKLILLSFFLSMFPVATLGTFSYLRSSSAIQTKVNAANLHILLQNQQRVEQVFKTIEHSVTQFASSPLAIEMLEKNITFREFQLFYQIQRELNNLQTIDLPIHDIYLVNFLQKWLIHKDGLQVLSEEEADHYASMSVKPWSLDTQRMNQNGVQFFKKTPNDFANRYASIFVKISQEQMDKLVSDNHSLGEVMILNDQFEKVAGSQQSPAGNEVDIPALAAQIQSMKGQEGYFTTGMGKSKSRMAFRQSDYNGWYYVSVTSLASLNVDSRAIGWFTLLTCIGIFILTVAIGLYVSSRLYTPISNLYQTANNLGTAKKLHNRISDEFQFIIQRFHSLVQSESDLNLQHSKQLPLLRDQFVQLLYEGRVRRNEAETKWNHYGFPEATGGLGLIAIEIDTLDETRYREKDSDLLLFAISNMIGELIPVQRVLHVMRVQQKCMVLVRYSGNNGKTLLDDYYAYVEQIQDKVQSYLNLTVSIGLSLVFHHLTEADAAYTQCLHALNSRIMFESAAIVYAGDLQPQDANLSGFPTKEMKALTEAIQLADEQAAKARLGNVLAKSILHTTNVRMFQMILAGLLSELVKEILQPDEQLSAIHSSDKSVFHRLEQMKTVREAENWFWHEIVIPLISLVKHRRSRQERKISDRMVEIIHADYDKNISLESCAALLNYHPNYLKRVFRLDTGFNFSDYLSGHRLQKAKEWLVHTDLPLSEIAERLCYSNLQNFNRYFRNMEGMSPRQYKETHELSALARFPIDGE